MITKDLSQYQDLFSEYTELRVQENRSLNILSVNGDILGNSKQTQNGVSARVYQNGSWGFASSSEFGQADIKKVIVSARENAIALDSKEKKNKPALPTAQAEKTVDFSTRKNRFSQKELIDFVKSIDDHIKQNCPKLISRTVSLQCLDMKKTTITADQSYSYSMIPRSVLYIMMSTLDDQGNPVELYDIVGARGQFEDVFSSIDNPVPPSGAYIRRA